MKGPLSQLFSILFISIFVLHGCSSNSKSKGDTRPDAFTISAQNDVEPDTVVESDPFTIEGINRPATVTLSGIEGATFSVNGGAPLSSGGTVNNGDQVVIQATSPDTYEDDATLTVDIGGERSEFVISTGPDETPPEVTILFPPPSTMTEGSTVFVRGTVEDLYGEVSTLLVNGVEVDISAGLPEWSVTVPLEDVENVITVTATDAAGNENNGQSVNVRMDPEGGPFPDNENPSVMIGYSGDFGTVAGRVAYIVPDYSGEQVLAIDVETGSRSIVASDEGDDPVPFGRLRYLVLAGNDRAFVTSLDTVFEVDLKTGAKRVVVPSGESDGFVQPRGLAFDQNQNSFYVSDKNSIYMVEAQTYVSHLVVGESEGIENIDLDSDIVSLGNTVGANGNSLHILTAEAIYIADISANTMKVVHENQNAPRFWDFDIVDSGSIFIADSSGSNPAVWRFEPETATVELLSSATTANVFDRLSGIDCIDGSYCVLVDPTTNTLYAMDVSSGHRVVLTHSIQE